MRAQQMKRKIDGSLAQAVIRPTESTDFMRLQHDSGKCPTKKCAFRYKSRSAIEKVKKKALVEELDAHLVDVPKGGKMVLVNALIDHYASEHGIQI